MAIVTEKQTICDFLETYKCLPCLWDQSDKLYTSKVARDQAYEILVEKFRPIQPNATVETVKKKIENMRSAYRREYKKVLEAQVAGSEHNPKLWYYNRLTFLEKEWPTFAEDTSTTKPQYSSGDEEEFQIQSTSGKLVYEEPPKKRVKVNKISYEELHKEEEDDDDPPLIEPAKHDTHIPIEDMNYEAESFGRTVGLQLKQMSQMQKTIAEKLISEVIFYGRLDKLTLNSALNVNEFS